MYAVACPINFGHMGCILVLQMQRLVSKCRISVALWSSVQVERFNYLQYRGWYAKRRVCWRDPRPSFTLVEEAEACLVVGQGRVVMMSKVRESCRAW